MLLARSLLALAFIALPSTSALSASQKAAPPAIDGGDEAIVEQILFHIADQKRMKATVRIGDGPDLAFIVDTGAERSAIATEVANRLALSASGSLRVVSFGGVGEVPTVRIPSLSLGSSHTKDVEVLTFDQKSLGADGMLGIDSLRDKVVFFDFDQRQMRIEKAGAPLRESADSVRLSASKRDGRLVFATAKVDRISTAMILDTGSDITVGNAALRRKLERQKRLKFIKTVKLLTTTGRTVRIDYTLLDSAQFGPVLIRNLPIAFSTVEPFKKLGLSKKPAMLLGMDALRAFGEVAVDFRHQRVRFTEKKARELASR